MQGGKHRERSSRTSSRVHVRGGRGLDELGAKVTREVREAAQAVELGAEPGVRGPVTREPGRGYPENNQPGIVVDFVA